MGMYLEFYRLMRPPDELIKALQLWRTWDVENMDIQEINGVGYKVKYLTDYNRSSTDYQDNIKAYIRPIDLVDYVLNLRKVIGDFHIPEGYVYDGFYTEGNTDIYTFSHSVQSGTTMEARINSSNRDQYIQHMILPYHILLTHGICSLSENWPFLRALAEIESVHDPESYSGGYYPIKGAIRHLLEHPEEIANNPRCFKPEDNLPTTEENGVITVHKNTGLYPKNYVQKMSLDQQYWDEINREIPDSDVFMYVNW